MSVYGADTYVADKLFRPTALPDQMGARLSFPLSPQEKRALYSVFFVPVTVNLKSTEPATAANYAPFFTADKAYTVVSATEVHGTAGSDGGAVTLQLEKLTGTTAPDSGTVLLSTAFNLKGTANTVQYGTFVATDAVVLQRGDRLCLKDAGVMTAVANLQVTIFLQPI